MLNWVDAALPHYFTCVFGNERDVIIYASQNSGLDPRTVVHYWRIGSRLTFHVIIVVILSEIHKHDDWYACSNFLESESPFCFSANLAANHQPPNQYELVSRTNSHHSKRQPFRNHLYSRSQQMHFEVKVQDMVEVCVVVMHENNEEKHNISMENATNIKPRKSIVTRTIAFASLLP